MKPQVCAVDGRPSLTKMATVIWSYSSALEGRSAWEQKFCAAHFEPIHRMLKSNARGNISCMRDETHELGDQSGNIIWAWVYMPKGARQDGYLEVCDDCIEDTLADTQLRCRVLPDREPQGQEAGGPPAPDPWAAFR